jgi:hypothetical protein
VLTAIVDTYQAQVRFSDDHGYQPRAATSCRCLNNSGSRPERSIATKGVQNSALRPIVVVRHAAKNLR